MINLSSLSRSQLIAFNKKIYASIVGTHEELLNSAKKKIDLLQKDQSASLIAINLTTKMISLVKVNREKQLTNVIYHEFSQPASSTYSVLEYAALGNEIAPIILALEPKACKFIYFKRNLHFHRAFLVEFLQAHCVSALGKENQPLAFLDFSFKRTESLVLSSNASVKSSGEKSVLSKYQKQQAFATNAELWARTCASISPENLAVVERNMDSFTNCFLALDAYFSVLNLINIGQLEQ